MNYIGGIVNGPKSPTTEPRCHSDQVDPLVIKDTDLLKREYLHCSTGNYDVYCQTREASEFMG